MHIYVENRKRSFIKEKVLRKWSKCSVSVSDKFASDYMSMCEKEKSLRRKKTSKVIINDLPHTSVKTKSQVFSKFNWKQMISKVYHDNFLSTVAWKIRKTGFETVCEFK